MRQMLRAGALGRPRGMGWRGRQEGGSRWGTHVNPWLIHVNVLQKTPQHCKVISLQLIKINEKKIMPPLLQTEIPIIATENFVQSPCDEVDIKIDLIPFVLTKPVQSSRSLGLISALTELAISYIL